MVVDIDVVVFTEERSLRTISFLILFRKSTGLLIITLVLEDILCKNQFNSIQFNLYTLLAEVRS